MRLRLPRSAPGPADALNEYGHSARIPAPAALPAGRAGAAAGPRRGRSTGSGGPAGRVAGPCVALRPRPGRVVGRRPQPAADQRRPAGHRRRCARRAAHRFHHLAAGRWQRTRGAAPGRRAPELSAAPRCVGVAAALARGRRADRPAHRRGPAAAAAQRPLPGRPHRRQHLRGQLEGRAAGGRRRRCVHGRVRPAGRGLARGRQGRVAEPARRDAARRLRGLGRQCRRQRRAQRRQPLCLARDDRGRGSRPQRPLGAGARYRPGLGALRRGGGLGTVPLRPLGLDPALGLDLDRRCALGLCTVPLRSLVALGWPLVLVARRLPSAPGVRAGAGGLDRRPELQRLDRHRRPIAARRGLGAAGAARALRALLPCQPRV